MRTKLGMKVTQVVDKAPTVAGNSGGARPPGLRLGWSRGLGRWPVEFGVEQGVADQAAAERNGFDVCAEHGVSRKCFEQPLGLRYVSTRFRLAVW